MTRRKRPYVPKIKGCYECSQRRIDCDRTQPSCMKCSAKGIACSGFGVKYRFRDGFSKRPTVSRRRSPPSFCPEASSQIISPWTPFSDLVQSSNLNDGDTSNGSPSTDCSREVFDVIAEYASALECHDMASSNFDDAGTSPRQHEEGYDGQWQNISAAGPEDALPDASFAHLDATKSFLLKHFSGKIAPEMVVIDGKYNGWRHVVLPIALTNDLVMSAVLAAAAFHLAGTTGFQTVPDPRGLYSRAIRELQHRRELTGCDAETRQMVILAIVVLLVAVMINGCSDFPVMFRMLQSALDAIGGESGLEDGGEVGEFSLRQIRKMRVYAAPLLSQNAGLYAIVAQAGESFDCLDYYTRLYPQYSPVFGILANLRQQAFDIYLDRVLGEGGDHDSANKIGHFIRTLESFPQGSPGEHVLTWPCFIAASESRDPQHQAFFENFLWKQYVRNGFANILRALELLQRIWTTGASTDWPALLPEPQVFIM